MEIKGRFAPTPSGELHLGNIMCAMLSYLSARSAGGSVALRVEDLDFERCRFEENTKRMLDDLDWLGIRFDEGYDRASYQSSRFPIYEKYLSVLEEKGLIYPCYCSRAELHASTAPHLSDGNVLYDGRCYRRYLAGDAPPDGKRGALRVHVPDETVAFHDRLQGDYEEYLPTECGDFIVRRSDGVYAYQLAVVVDDALTGITEVVRGRDLISSTPRQIWLYRELGFTPPSFCHVPLLLGPDGRRLSKRDGDGLSEIRKTFPTARDVIGLLAYNTGIIPELAPIGIDELVPLFSWEKVPKNDIILKVK